MNNIITFIKHAVLDEHVKLIWGLRQNVTWSLFSPVILRLLANNTTGNG